MITMTEVAVVTEVIEDQTAHETMTMDTKVVV